MNRHYLSLWALLATAFAVFAIASAFEMPQIMGHTLKSAELPELFADAETDNEVDTALIAAADTVVHSRPVFPVPCDTAAQTILFIGDSMLEGLGPRMAAYAGENGHTLYNVMWYSSTSEIWGSSARLKDYIAKLQPTYVFICLGSNELFVNDIAKKRRGFVQNIIADIDTIPYVWIGPPNWKPDTGINQLISEETKPGCFFLSNGMSFERSKDGAHPTRSSAALWLDSVARWMPDNCLHPIKMNKPTVHHARPKRIFVHQPSER